jgi:hypothetical protein
MALNGKWLMCNLKKTVLVATQGRFFMGVWWCDMMLLKLFMYFKELSNEC